jgi:ABC-type phosphate transport system permease subunit
MMSIYSDTDPTYIQHDKFTKFNSSFDKMENVTDSVDDIESSITNAQTDFGLFGVLNSLISTSWQSLKLMFSSFAFMDSVWKGTNYIFGVPIWVASLIGLLVTVVIAFAIWSAIFQREL